MHTGNSLYSEWKACKVIGTLLKTVRNPSTMWKWTITYFFLLVSPNSRGIVYIDLNSKFFNWITKLHQLTHNNRKRNLTKACTYVWERLITTLTTGFLVSQTDLISLIYGHAKAMKSDPFPRTNNRKSRWKFAIWAINQEKQQDEPQDILVDHERLPWQSIIRTIA